MYVGGWGRGAVAGLDRRSVGIYNPPVRWDVGLYVPSSRSSEFPPVVVLGRGSKLSCDACRRRGGFGGT